MIEWYNDIMFESWVVFLKKRSGVYWACNLILTMLNILLKSDHEKLFEGNILRHRISWNN